MISSFRYRVAALILAALLLNAGDGAGAGPNHRTTLVMHAQTEFVHCALADPCLAPAGPSVTITDPGRLVNIYVVARNYDHLAGIQWAFDWHPSWIVYGGGWTCPPGALGIPFPPPYGPGPVQGSCTSAFDCLSGGSSQVIGSLQAVPGEGCLEIIESALPDGTHALSCSYEVDPIAPANRARVCVGSGGLNTCESAVPVEPATWGTVKALYR